MTTLAVAQRPIPEPVGDTEPTPSEHHQIVVVGGGTAGITGVAYPLGSVNITQGEDLITEYEIEPGATRRFCSRCGSPTFGSTEKFIIVQAGTLAEDPGVRPQFHMMVDFKAPWDEIHDDLPQFGEYPPMEA